MGFGPLRVINEDWIAPGRGFGAHGHRDMEILTYVIDGTLAHRDGEGNASTLRRGRAQLMHAGRGIVHSEMNGSAEQTAHLLQIWNEPDRLGLAPGYAELDFTFDPGALRAIATPEGREGGLAIQQDACVYALQSDAKHSFEYAMGWGRAGRYGSRWRRVTASSRDIASRPETASRFAKRWPSIWSVRRTWKS